MFVCGGKRIKTLTRFSLRAFVSSCEIFSPFHSSRFSFHFQLFSLSTFNSRKAGYPHLGQPLRGIRESLNRTGLKPCLAQRHGGTKNSRFYIWLSGSSRDCGMDPSVDIRDLLSITLFNFTNNILDPAVAGDTRVQNDSGVVLPLRASTSVHSPARTALHPVPIPETLETC